MVARLHQIQNDYAADSVRAAYVQYWAMQSGIDLRSFAHESVSRDLIERADAREVFSLVRRIQEALPKITLKDVEKSFEFSLGESNRKYFGAVYTPEYIIDFLSKNALRFGWRDRRKTPKICDPSCGSGGFLVRIAEILDREYGISGDRAFGECIIGIDVDERALEQAKCLIELYLASKNQVIPDLTNALHKLDTLVSGVNEIFALSNVSDGFDVVVTNPPYVKFQNLSDSYRHNLRSIYNHYAQGNFSLSVLFLVKGYDLLSSKGSLGMITQNNLFTSLAGKNIREFIRNQECIQQIVDFGHYKVFENASAYTCLVFLNRQHSQEFDYARINDGKNLDLSSLERLAYTKVSYPQLASSKWRLGENRHLDNIRKIEATGKPLRTIANIKVGFATLKDSVFFVREIDGICVATLPDGEYVEIENELTRAAIKVSEIKRPDDVIANMRRIIFPYTKKSGSYKLISERDLKDEFPNTYLYLSAYRTVLGSRDKGKKQYENWYAWARTQGMEALAPKLLTKTFSKFPKFYLDYSDQLFCNGYSISPKPETLFEPSVAIEYLARVLNSKVMHYYAKLTSFQLEGDYQCYQKNFIEKFGVPILDDSLLNDVISKNQEDADEIFASIYGIANQDLDDVTGRP